MWKVMVPPASMAGNHSGRGQEPRPLLGGAGEGVGTADAGEQWREELERWC